MRVLLLTSMFPSHESPHGGTFIARRIEAMLLHGVSVQAWAIGGFATRTDESFDWASTGSYRTWELAVNRLAPARLGLSRVTSTVLSGLTEPPDVIVAHGMYLPPAGAIARRLSEFLDVPYVIFGHGSDVNSVLPRHPHGFRRILEGAAACIYVSESLLARAVAEGAPIERAHVVPNGVDLSVFSSLGRDGEGRDSVTFVGSLLPVKGADRLPGIFSHIAAQATARFIVAGDGPLRAGLESQVLNLGLDVTFTGILAPAEVASVLHRTRVLVLPSRSEGWPCTVLEGHAAGALVVGTDVGGVLEAVGDARCVVPSDGDVVGALGELIVRSLHEPDPAREDRIERARSFSWERTVRAELEIIQEVLDVA